MADVIVVGDGPGGLSAALFLAKNGKEVVVFGEDKTAMHFAFLKNYLGLPAISGTEFQRIARAQASAQGATFEPSQVDSVRPAPGPGPGQEPPGFEVHSAGRVHRARYLILSEGKNPILARTLGLKTGERGEIAADRNGRTSADNVYVVGRSARPGRSQAIISAGDGAAAALDILSREKGQDFADWDTPEKT
jgi:thioredoxin reductase